jgi:hypothetical protein
MSPVNASQWLKTHKPEAALGAGGIAVGLYAYIKNKNSSATTTSTTGADTLSPGVGGGGGDDWAPWSGINPGGVNQPVPTTSTSPTSTTTPKAPKAPGKRKAAPPAHHDNPTSQELAQDRTRRLRSNAADRRAQLKKNAADRKVQLDKNATRARNRRTSDPGDALKNLTELQRHNGIGGGLGTLGGGPPVVLGTSGARR